MKTPRALTVATVAMALQLSACGGGGGGTTEPPSGGTPPTQTPDAGAASAPPATGTTPVPSSPPNSGPAPTPGNTPTPPPTNPPAQSGNYRTTGAWSPVFDWPVIGLHAALLPDGRVMSYGTDTSALGGNQFRYDVWDPTAVLGSAASHLTLDVTTGTYLFCSSLILTPTSGQLLINGGDVLQNGRAINRGNSDVNTFNPLDNSLTRTGSMQRPRWYGTATTLPTGETYIQGGTDGEDHPEIRGLDSVYRLLPGINTLATSPGAGGARYFDNNYPRNFVAPNGKLFGFDPHWMYELDPHAANGTGALVRMFGAHWDIPSTNGGDNYRGWAATSASVMLAPGQILQVGGTQANATLIDINSGTPVLTDLPPMPQVRQWVSATVLPDGKVFTSGGSTKNLLNDPANMDAGTIWFPTLMFDPTTRTWTTTAALSVPRLYHSITLLLPDATVLSTGGGGPGPYTNLNAQVYYPGYLYDAQGNFAARPRITQSGGGLPQVLQPSSTFGISSDDAADIARITLIKTGAVTHSFDMEQRFMELPFTRAGNQITATLPANSNLTPPGYYMVFIINQQGVPSKAKMIRINPVP